MDICILENLHIICLGSISNHLKDKVPCIINVVGVIHHFSLLICRIHKYVICISHCRHIYHLVTHGCCITPFWGNPRPYHLTCVIYFPSPLKISSALQQGCTVVSPLPYQGIYFIQMIYRYPNRKCIAGEIPHHYRKCIPIPILLLHIKAYYIASRMRYTASPNRIPGLHNLNATFNPAAGEGIEYCNYLAVKCPC